MVKSVLGVHHQGYNDWAIQRLSALVVAFYSIGLILYLILNPGLSFAEWHGLFGQSWMKVATLATLLAVSYHAWIGIWTIFTDYIKCAVLRAILNCIVLSVLFTSFIWGILIVWSV